MNDLRKTGLATWAKTILAGQGSTLPAAASLVSVSDDASFRRYFRLSTAAPGLVLVDAPPLHEDNESWVRIARALHDQGLSCPAIHAVNLDEGYLIISDLGDNRYLDVMTAQPDRIQTLMQEATAALLSMQALSLDDLPSYDAKRLNDEMNLFDEWFLPRLLGLELDSSTETCLQETKTLLTANALAQPQVFVHRDFHSRNLMVLDQAGPGIIDFQDAVLGPITYDLVSLYKDCYYRLPRQAVVAAVADFQGQLQNLPEECDPGCFLKWFDLMGVQRHLKCAGIFSRLCLRDGKPNYLDDLPLVLDYLLEACTLYDDLAPLGELLSSRVMPQMQLVQPA